METTSTTTEAATTLPHNDNNTNHYDHDLECHKKLELHHVNRKFDSFPRLHLPPSLRSKLRDQQQHHPPRPAATRRVHQTSTNTAKTPTSRSASTNTSSTISGTTITYFYCQFSLWHFGCILIAFLYFEVLLGITGKDFVLTAADSTAARGIVVQNRGEDKSRALNAHNIMLFSGEPGDTVQFAEYIQCNTQLYRIRNGLDLSTKAVSSFVRKELATSLRSRHPYTVNLLIGGVDPKTGAAELYWIDYLSACVKLDFAAHGYASYFCMSTMDRYWQPGLSLEEAKELLRKCLAELKVRFIGNLPDFTVKVVDKDGIREIVL
ncbi:Proteasome subunit beta type-4 [Entophlyctis sp. JEL0112]|nr:Proteasome subunit beta type-4 [Entophlyctis sp. JEL0112]